MKNVIIADYIGNSSRDGTVSGHLQKVLNDLNYLLKDTFDLQYVVCSNYVEGLDDCNVIGQLERISIHSSKFREILQRKRNISKILQSGKTIWFVNIDFWFFLFLIFSNTRGKEIFITNYLDYSKGSTFKRVLYKLASKKIRSEFTTIKDTWMPNQSFIPDYWYDEEQYEVFCEGGKKEQVVICGAISRAKDINGVIGAFKQNNYPLMIKGRFETDELFNNCINAVNGASNIQIDNKRLSDAEYYSLIGESKYVLLPYRKENYSGRSSGVMLESVFMDSIVIAPRFLLDELGISGYGYDKISDLIGFDDDTLSSKRIKEILAANGKIKELYSKKEIKKVYVRRLCGD